MIQPYQETNRAGEKMELEVETRALYQSSDEFNYASKKLASIDERTNRVISELKFLSCTEEARWVLSRERTKLQRTGESLRRMSDVLEEAGQQYEKTENKLLSQGKPTIFTPMHPIRYVINGVTYPQFLNRISPLKILRPLIPFIYPIVPFVVHFKWFRMRKLRPLILAYNPVLSSIKRIVRF